MIHPTLDVHDGLTIDPGLISIAMDYGHMRAFDALRWTEVPEDTQRLRDSSDLIARLQNGRLAHRVSCERRQARNTAPGVGRGARSPRPPDPDGVSSVRALKRQIHAAVQARIGISPTAVPPTVEAWWRAWERHPWMPYSRHRGTSLTPLRATSMQRTHRHDLASFGRWKSANESAMLKR